MGTAGLKVLAAAALVAGALVGCGSGPAIVNGHPVITLYNGQHPETTEALVAAFEKQTGIHVKERDGDESQLSLEIQQEGGSSPADVFYSENSPVLMALQEKKVFAPLPASVLGEVPSRYNSPAGDWVAVSARVGVLVYNPALVPAGQLPTSVLDLAQPRWKGKLALAPTETDFQPIVTAVVHAIGKRAAVAWLRAVKANGASHTYSDNEALTAAINDGQAAIGLIDHYYWWRLRKEMGASSMHARIAFFAAGDPGYVLDVSGAGVLASSKHRAEAQQLVDFLASGGQPVIVGSDSFEYPLHPGVAPAAGLTPLAQLQPNPMSIADLGDGSVAIDLLQQVQLL